MEEKLYWITKKGKKLDIDKMDIDHLRNVVKIIVRNRKDSEDQMYDKMIDALLPSEDSGFHIYEDYKL